MFWPLAPDSLLKCAKESIRDIELDTRSKGEIVRAGESAKTSEMISG
jgi:hypothetical protein